MLQRYINKWVSTAHDLFGVDASSSAHWAYVWGIKGRWDERKKLDAGIDVNKEVLNEESRGHYHEEIVGEVKKLCGYLPGWCKGHCMCLTKISIVTLVQPKDRISMLTVLPFKGTDEEYATYLTTVFPTAQDEVDLKELFEQEWIANKPMSTRQIESGIGATA